MSVLIPSTLRRRARMHSRKIFAAAAIGLTASVGAGVTTLASWSSHQNVWGGTGDTGAVAGGAGSGLRTSKFLVETSVNGTAYLDLSTAPGGQLSFSTTAGALSPGTTTYAFVRLRTGATSSVGGTVTLAGASAYTGSDPGLFAALRYGAKASIAQSDCSASGYASAPGATTLVTDGAALASGSGSTGFALPAPASAGAAGTAVGVCFALSLPQGVDAVLSGKSVTPVWSFDALSD